jgi:hypothetical protein
MLTQSGGPTRSLGRALRHCQLPVVTLAPFVVLHGLLLFLDFRRPYVFLRADRAVTRIEALHGLASVSGWHDLLHYLGTHGVFGDYAFHALLYLVWGWLGVVLVQIALVLISGLAVLRLGYFVGLAPGYRAFAAALYLMLPQSLVFSHQLSTEALHVPLLVVSTWLTCEALLRASWTKLGAAGLVLSAATLIRPITLFWPLIVLLTIAISHRPRLGIVFCTSAYLPIVAWMLVVMWSTGTFGLGESNHSLSANLYGRVREIAATLPQAERDRVRRDYRVAEDGEGRLTTNDYLAFGLQYPRPFVLQIVRDTAVFFGKSGIERISIDYFANAQQFASITNPREDWRRRLDRDGPLAAIRYALQTLGATFAVSVAGSALLVAMLTCSAGGWISLRRKLPHWRHDCASSVCALIVMFLPVYIYIVSLVVTVVQSRQRAPAEFALAILAACGLAAFAREAAASAGSRSGVRMAMQDTTSDRSSR